MIKIEKIYKQFEKKSVLKGVSFEVQEGSIYGLVGKNGAGKTTLLTIMAGLIYPDSGSCKMNQCTICFLPDIPTFYDYLSCGEYIDFLLMDVSGKASNYKQKLLTLVSLDENAQIKTLSRGMRQRLGIAASLVNNPDILLLDEPASALDPAGRMELMEILLKLKKNGKSIILSTHVLADMEKICDEVGFLHDGIIKKSVRISDLKERSAYKVVFEKKYDVMDDIPSVKIHQINENTVIFRLKVEDVTFSQHHLFRYLSTIDNPVISFQNEMRDLDTLFREVCNE